MVPREMVRGRGPNYCPPSRNPQSLCKYHWSWRGGRLFMNRFIESGLLLGAEAAVVNGHHK